jgi:drug/metabolite transporter (DMT)-like permease
VTLSQFLRFLALSAIWGASFLFQRISVPSFGPVVMVTLRVLLGAVFMFGLCSLMKTPLNLKENWKHYAIIGFLNVALPFMLFGYAAQNVNASVMSILNATAAIWAAIITAVWTRQWPHYKMIAGLILGIAGVTVLAQTGTQVHGAALSDKAQILGILAGVLAGFSYALASVYTRYATKVDVMATAHGTLWLATLMLLPLVPFNPVHHVPGWVAWVSMTALGLVCSGLAFYLYFGLIKDLGAAKSMSVTYMIPVFGVFWGVVILHEPFGPLTLLAGAAILSAVALITGLNPMILFKKPVITA